MAYVKCITKKGVDVEIVSGIRVASGQTTFTVSSQKGKAPKCLQLWRSDDVTTMIFRLMWQKDSAINGGSGYYCTEYSVTSPSGTAVHNYREKQVGEYESGAAGVRSIGDTSVTLLIPYNSQSSWVWKYSVVFE